MKGSDFSPGLVGPLPVGEFRLIDAKFVGMASVLDKLIFQPLLEVSPGDSELGNSVDDIHRQIETIDLVLHGQFGGVLIFPRSLGLFQEWIVSKKNHAHAKVKGRGQ